MTNVTVRACMTKAKAYHTTECDKLTQMQHDDRTVTKEIAERAGLRECKVCQNGGDAYND